MKTIFRRTLRIIFLLLVFFLALFFSVDLWCEFYGLPVCIQNMIRSSIKQSSPMDCRISWIRGGIFSGLKLEQVRLQQQSEQTSFKCSLPQIQCSLNLFSLLGSRIRMNSLQLNNVTAYYQYSPDTPVFFFENGYLNLQYSRNNTINIVTNVKTEGIRIQGRCNLEDFTSENFQQALVRIQNQLKFLSAPSSSESLSPLLNRFHSCRFGDDDASLTFTLSGSLLSPDDLHGKGNFSLNTALLNDVIINKCRGHFTLQNYVVNLSDLHLIFGHGEILKTQATINLKKETLSASCKGDLTPSIALQYTPFRSSSLFSNLTFHNPIHVDASLPETPWDLQQMKADLDLKFRNLDLRATKIHHGEMKIFLSPDLLSIRNILIAGDFYEQNKLTGDLRYEIRKQKLSGKLNGDLPLLQILADNNVDFNKLSPRQLQKKHQISLTLEPSSLDLAELKLNGCLRQSELKILGRNFSDYRIPFRLQNGILEITGAGLTLPDGKNTADLTCRLDLLKLLQQEQETVKMALKVFAFSSRMEWEPALELKADFLLNLKNSTLALNQGQGKIHISRLYNTYVPILALPQDEILALITCEKTPAQFTCRIPEFSLKSPESIVMEGKAEAQDSKFNRLTVHQATCDFRLTPNKFSFKNIRATVDNDEKLELDLFAQIYPFYIEIKNGKILGQPNLISNFIFDEEAEALYRQIWKDVRWDSSATPQFNLKHLLYSESEDDLSWALELQGSAQIAQARYSGYLIPKVEAKIQMNLPEFLEIKPITVTTDDGKIEGHCQILLDNDPQCQFSVSEKAGTVDILRLLDALYPEWKKAFPDLQLPSRSKISCHGSFYLNPGVPAVRLSGSFAVPWLKFRKIQAQDLSGIWNFQNEKLFWDIREAEMKKGRLRCSGIFDWNSQMGESQFSLTRIPLTEVISIFSEDRPANSTAPGTLTKGFIDSSGKIRFYRNWIGKELLLEGDTRLSVREADLWHVPLFSSLGKMLAMSPSRFFAPKSLSNLGVISELDADVEFHGERLHIPKLSTNGTIIALNGSGEYSLLHDRLNFNITGEALKSVNVLSFFLKPLSWVFQAELTGPVKDPKWKIRTALHKIFSTE